MKTSTCIVYHSGYGHTEVIAQAIANGAKTDTNQTELIKISPQGTITEEQWKQLDEAHAIIFGSPTYMGSVSGPFKLFMDATSKRWMQQTWDSKLAGGFTNSGCMSGDKLNTLVQLAILAGQLGMIWISTGDIPAPNPQPHQPDPKAINRIGSFLGVMAQSENDDPSVTPPQGDIKTAKKYGQRIAHAVARWNK